MRSLRREPVLLLALLAAIALVLAFIVDPQIQVVLVPGADGYVSFLQGGTWTLPLTNSIKITLLSTTGRSLLAPSPLLSMAVTELNGRAEASCVTVPAVRL